VAAIQVIQRRSTRPSTVAATAPLFSHIRQ
jgi:hypothetical protein